MQAYAIVNRACGSWKREEEGSRSGKRTSPAPAMMMTVPAETGGPSESSDCAAAAASAVARQEWKSAERRQGRIALGAKQSFSATEDFYCPAPPQCGRRPRLLRLFLPGCRRLC